MEFVGRVHTHIILFPIIHASIDPTYVKTHCKNLKLEESFFVLLLYFPHNNIIRRRMCGKEEIVCLMNKKNECTFDFLLRAKKHKSNTPPNGNNSVAGVSQAAERVVRV